MSNEIPQEEFAVGRVVAAKKASINQNLYQSTGMLSTRQILDVEILEGRLKGMIAPVANEITDNPVFNIDVGPGQEVVLAVVSQPGQKTEINIADYHRAPALGEIGRAHV